ncbi:hypothetical protein Syun_012788 [Stephania yunnanensis]|uniref:Uncharacterized protein n=1 Tax=Stephania yunnanensis TaxID=152371 RepID=A0AAP0K1G3_9MAGN
MFYDLNCLVQLVFIRLKFFRLLFVNKLEVFSSSPCSFQMLIFTKHGFRTCSSSSKVNDIEEFFQRVVYALAQRRWDGDNGDSCEDNHYNWTYLVLLPELPHQPILTFSKI